VAGIRLFWYKLDNNTISNGYGVTIIDENNTSKTINISAPLSYEIKDIIRDEDNNFLILYKRPVTTTMRERCFPITSIYKNFFDLPDYNGLTDGIKVYYINKGGTTDMVSPDYIYTLKKNGTVANVNFYLHNEAGATISLKQPLTGNHFIVTYDNKYAIQRNLGGTNRPYPLLPSYDFTTSPVNEQLSAGDLIYYNKVGADATVLYGTSITGKDGKGGGTRSVPLSDTPYYIMPVGTGLTGTKGRMNPDLLLYENSGPNKVIPANFLDYIVTDGYYHSVGGYPMLDNYKVINQYLPTAYDSPDYFSLNSQGFYTYGITSFDPDNHATNGIIFLQDNFDYIYDQSSKEYDINGINRGITYVYNSLDDDIKINSKKIDGKNYLIINKGLCYTPEYDNSRYINQFIQLEYDISKDSDTGSCFYTKNSYDNTLITNVGLSRNILSYSIVKSISQNQSKGFYYKDVKNGENNIDYININSNDSIFYTLINNNDLGNTSDNSLAINSKYEEIAFVNNTNNEPELNYPEFSNFQNLKPLPFSSLVNVNKRKPGENYFIEEKNYIYIYNQTDINNILNFSSSELVLTKEGPVQIYPTPRSGNFTFKNQITWCLVNIVEYEVNLDTEYLKIKIQVPIKYNDLIDIITDPSQWNLHVYNFVKLDYFHLHKLDPVSSTPTYKSHTYQISDASLMFTGSKGNEYYKDNYKLKNNNLYRTGYNNIMTKTAGKNSTSTSNTAPTAGVNFSIYKVTDGAGIYMDKVGKEMVAITNTVQYNTGDGNNLYNINATVSYIDINIDNTSVANVDAIAPTYLPYDYTVGYKSINVDGGLLTNGGGTNYIYIPTDGTVPDIDLSQWSSFSNGRFFISFLPITWTQFDIKAARNISQPVATLPLQDNVDNIAPSPLTPRYYFQNIVANHKSNNNFSQFMINSNDSYTDTRVGSDNAKLRRIFGGAIRLPYGDYDDVLYTVNDLFASSLPLGDTFFINSGRIKRDNIIANVGYDKDGLVIIKNLGNIPLQQTHMAHYQTGVKGVEADYFNQTNQVAIKFPKWLKARFVNRNSEIPKIRKVIINSNDGNNYANATYYAFIEYGGNTSLVYLDAENNNYDLAENQGIPTSRSIFKDGDNVKIAEPGFAMTGTDRLLYMLSKDCN
jgi:hypothetical protein